MVGKITALKVQTKNQRRVNVFIDGNFAFGVHRNIASELQIGQELTEEAINAILKKDEEEMAFQRALRYIQFRERSETEVVRYLQKFNVSADIITKVLDHLRYLELINDDKFAEHWAENRNAFRPRSRRVLTMELRKKGISEEVIAQVMQSMPSEEELAYQSAMKQARRYHDLPRQEFHHKLSNYLSRRGFSYEVISPVIAQVWENTQKQKEY